jgi:hypothetical protein
MKLTSAAAVLLIALSALSCRPKEQPAQEMHAQPQQPAATATIHQGVVQEVLQATAYTYLRVKERDNDFWIAVTKRDVNVGDTVSFAEGLEMKNFPSKDLNRTFDTVYFVSQLTGGAPLAAHGPSMPLAAHGPSMPLAAHGPSMPLAAHSPSTPMAHQGKPTVEQVPLSIERPEGIVSIGELFANKASYAGKTVLVHGEVVKINRSIMNKNWVHLQDGTGNAGSCDLTITTQDDATPGTVATFSGTIALNRDFGSGYAYDVLLEDGKKQSE